MRRAVLLMMSAAVQGGCVLVQDEYDRQSLEECREDPAPNKRLDCERRAHDAAAERRRDHLSKD
ncbi:MAG: hypothetical protein ACE37M_13765 [Henriciella sp.]